MSFLRKPRCVAVNKAGAAAGCLLHGVGPNNRGIRLRVLQGQEKGSDGPIRGGFAILDVGDNMHSGALEPLLHRMTDAAEVLAIIRKARPGCVSVVNTNILAPEEP